MVKTNLDEYLEALLQDPVFTVRFKRAGNMWDEVIQRVEGSDSTFTPGQERRPFSSRMDDVTPNK